MNIQNNKKYETTTKDQQKRQIKTRPQNKPEKQAHTHAVTERYRLNPGRRLQHRAIRTALATMESLPARPV